MLVNNRLTTDCLVVNRKHGIFAIAYQKSYTGKLNTLYLSGFCHSMICPIQSSEYDTSRG